MLSLRGKNRIPACAVKQVCDPQEGPFTADQVANELRVSLATVHRWLRDGLLIGKQMTAGAPWRIRLTAELRRRLTGGDAPPGWVGLSVAARRLGISKGSVAHLVNTKKLNAVRTTVGKRTCWRIEVNSDAYGKQPSLF